MTYVLNDPQHWLDRAAKARAVAEQIDDLVARANMLSVAASYEQMAKRAANAVIIKVPLSDVLVAGK
jgi:hypothetical protein